MEVKNKPGFRTIKLWHPSTIEIIAQFCNERFYSFMPCKFVQCKLI